MSLECVAVMLMCACVVTSDVIADITTEAGAANFNEFISDWKPDTPDNETSGSPQHNTDRYLEDRLYESVCYNNYDKAVQQCKDIIKQGHSHIIKSAVDLFIEFRKYQVTPFAYKLWEANGRAVIEKLFPPEFKMVFNDSLVILTNYQYNLPIELDQREDLNDIDVLANDRNRSGRNYMWKLEPAYTDGNIYFKIRNIVDGRYLKLAKDPGGHYLAYGSPNSDTNEHLWMLQPVRHDGIILFFIVNRHHYQGLMLTKEVYGGDRTVLGIGGKIAENPDQCGWKIQIIKNVPKNTA